MKVVYYEDCITKEITRCDRLPEVWSEAQIKEDLDIHNADEDKDCYAAMAVIEDGSLAAFLFKEAERKQRYEQVLNELLDAIRIARLAYEHFEAEE